MTFDTRKTQLGQSVVEKIGLCLDGCKYATDAMLAARFVTIDASTIIAATGTGDSIILSAGDATLFGTECFVLLPTDEVVRTTISNATTLVITGRGELGTDEAAHSGTGDAKIMHQGEADGSCWGFSQTCNSVDSYDAAAVRELIFTTDKLKAGEQFLPGLVGSSIRFKRPTVNPGETIGTRASLSFTITDGKHNDYLVNPYSDRRSTAGTLFGKLLARHPYMEKRKVYYYEGLRDARLIGDADFKKYAFVIDLVNLDDGKADFRCLDFLSLADHTKALIPAPSESRLAAAMTTTSTSFTVTDGPANEYCDIGEQAYVTIDKETMLIEGTGAYSYNIITREVQSQLQEHKANATVQIAYRKTSIHPIDFIDDALTNYTTIDASVFGDYSAIVTATPEAVLDEVFLTKPEPVKSRIDEAIQCGDLVLYADQESEEIAIEYFSDIDPEIILLTEDENILRDSVTVKRKPDLQYTQAAIYFGREDVNDTQDNNYSVRYTNVSPTLLSASKKDYANIAKTVKNKLLTASNDDTLTGLRYIQRKLVRCIEMPHTISFKLDAQDVGVSSLGDLRLGSIVSIATKEFQGKDGQPTAELYQILSIQGSLFRGYTIEAKRYQNTVIGNIDFTVSGNYENYDLGEYYAPAAGHYTILVDSESTFGGTSTNKYAFTTGTQAAGVSFTILFRAVGMGAGGRGGTGGYGIEDTANADPGPGYSGYRGGPVMELTVPVTLDVGSGLLLPGGGGGGGEESWFYVDYGDGSGDPIFTARPGNGGSGGQGYVGGKGGTPGFIQDATVGDGYGAPGQAGSIAGPGVWSADGGIWGEPGESSFVAPDRLDSLSNFDQSPGGDGGDAIVTNGNALTIIAGNNSLNIRGPIV